PIQATVKELKRIAFYSNISSLHSYTEMRKFYNGVNLEETQGKLGGIIEQLNEVDRQESSSREKIKRIQVKLMVRSFKNSLPDIIRRDANINLLSSNEQLLIIERLSKNYYDDLDSTPSLHQLFHDVHAISQPIHFVPMTMAFLDTDLLKLNQYRDTLANQHLRNDMTIGMICIGNYFVIKNDDKNITDRWLFRVVSLLALVAFVLFYFILKCTIRS
ncbi:unnamed protein product, partial [Didymodactylos carnosus]